MADKSEKLILDVVSIRVLLKALNTALSQNPDPLPQRVKAMEDA